MINIAKHHNLDETETYNYINSNENKTKLKKDEEQAKQIGVKGVPCFIINKQYVVFGAQEPIKFIDLFRNLIN